MTPKATQITTALLDLLKTIKPSNGYLTDIGNRVYSGRHALYQDTSPRPFACLIARNDDPENESRRRSRCVRDYDLVITLNATQDYDQVQDRLLYDVRRALSTQLPANVLGGLAQALTQSSATLDNPDLGSGTAQLTLTLSVSYGETYP